MKKVFKTIYYVFLGCIAAIAVLLMISIFPIAGNYKLLTVLSGSMEPAIRTGSIVIVKSVGDYKIGDVITFGEISKTKTPTSHRIFDIKVVSGEPVYITKGDANNGPDQKEIQKKNIVGKVFLDIPYVGYAVNAAKNPFGFMLIIIVPAVVIIYDELRKIFGQIKKMKEGKK